MYARERADFMFVETRVQIPAWHLIISRKPHEFPQGLNFLRQSKAPVLPVQIKQIFLTAQKYKIKSAQT